MLQLHFDPGGIDGVVDQATVYALHAVEKLAGLPRVGRLNPAEGTYLETFQYPTPLHPTVEPNRTEIDITKQVITLYQGYQVRLITTTSTASGEQFCYITPKRAPTQRICEVATTPNGRYAFLSSSKRRLAERRSRGAVQPDYYFFKGTRGSTGTSPCRPSPRRMGCVRIPDAHLAVLPHARARR